MTILKRATAIVLGSVLTIAMSINPATADVTELNVLAPEKSFPRVWRDYPAMNAEFERPGTLRSAAQVRSVAIGNSKQQLVRAVGQPVSAYPDGSWNFNIALLLPQRNRLICQYRVYFDDEERVVGTIWRRPQCVELVIASGT